MSAVEAAIRRVKESRQSHVEWRDHLAGCEHCKKYPPEYVDDAAGQERIIAEYDNVLVVLGSVQRVRALCEQGYVSRDPRGPFAGFLHDLRAALAPSDPATDTGGEGP